MDNAEIVYADVCKLRAARDLAEGPNTRCRSLEPFVHLDVSAIGEFNSRGHQQMSALRFFGSISIFLDKDPHRLAGFTRYPFDLRLEGEVEGLG